MSSGSVRALPLSLSLTLALTCLLSQLESVCGALVHGVESGATTPPLGPNLSARPSTPAQQAAAAKRKTLIHPTSFAFPVRADATDDELCALLESYLVRVENCLSTLTLHQLGPFTEVLSALGQALKVDQRSIMLALTRFAGLQQQQAMLLQHAQASKPPSPAPGRPSSAVSTMSRAGQPAVRRA